MKDWNLISQYIINTFSTRQVTRITEGNRQSGDWSWYGTKFSELTKKSWMVFKPVKVNSKILCTDFHTNSYTFGAPNSNSVYFKLKSIFIYYQLFWTPTISNCLSFLLRVWNSRIKLYARKYSHPTCGRWMEIPKERGFQKPSENLLWSGISRGVG